MHVIKNHMKWVTREKEGEREKKTMKKHNNHKNYELTFGFKNIKLNHQISFYFLDFSFL